MPSLAIYEFLGIIIALPLSYAMAKLAKKYSYDTYKDEIDRLHAAFWSGREEDELNAWLKVRQVFKDKNAPKRKKYIEKNINQVNKHHLYSNFYVNEKGEVKKKEKSSNPFD